MIAVIARTEPEHWRQIPAPGVWAIGKDVEHVIEAVGYHLTTDLTPHHAMERLRRASEEATALVRGLTDEQLNLPTRPPRARSQALAETIEQVLIGHCDTHRDQIDAKRRAFRA